MVYGHSGHVFRGVGIYRGHPVIYCAGNFIDDYAVDEVERNDESFVFVLEHTGHRLTRMFLRPTVIANCQANFAPSHQAEEIADKMTRLSAKLGTGATWNSKEGILEIAIPG